MCNTVQWHRIVRCANFHHPGLSSTSHTYCTVLPTLSRSMEQRGTNYRRPGAVHVSPVFFTSIYLGHYRVSPHSSPCLASIAPIYLLYTVSATLSTTSSPLYVCICFFLREAGMYTYTLQLLRTRSGSEVQSNFSSPLLNGTSSQTVLNLRPVFVNRSYSSVDPALENFPTRLPTPPHFPLPTSCSSCTAHGARSTILEHLFEPPG